MLDACRDDPFNAHEREVGAPRGLSQVETPASISTLYSARLNAIALDKLSASDPDPVFTRELLPLLHQPNLALVDIAKRLQVSVADLAMRSASHRQEPAFDDQVRGQVILVPGKAAAPPVAPPGFTTGIPTTGSCYTIVRSATRTGAGTPTSGCTMASASPFSVPSSTACGWPTGAKAVRAAATSRRAAAHFDCRSSSSRTASEAASWQACPTGVRTSGWRRGTVRFSTRRAAGTRTSRRSNAAHLPSSTGNAIGFVFGPSRARPVGPMRSTSAAEGGAGRGPDQGSGKMSSTGVVEVAVARVFLHCGHREVACPPSRISGNEDGRGPSLSRGVLDPLQRRRAGGVANG